MMPWLFIGWAAFIVAVVALSLLDESREDSNRRGRLFMIIVACLGVGDAASCSVGDDQGFERGYDSAMYHLAGMPIRAAIVELAPYRRDLSQHTTGPSASTP